MLKGAQSKRYEQGWVEVKEDDTDVKKNKDAGKGLRMLHAGGCLEQWSGWKQARLGKWCNAMQMMQNANCADSYDGGNDDENNNVDNDVGEE